MSLAGRCYYGCCRTRLGHRVMGVADLGMRKLRLRRSFRLPLDALSLDHESVRALMTLWSRIHWCAGDGMMPAEQLLAIFRLAVRWPIEGATVELGAWVGLTTCYLATACRVRGRGRVYAVDTFEGTREWNTRYPSVARFEGNTLSAFRERVRRADVEDLVEPLIGYTNEIGADYQGEPIRFLLIDADHSYEGVRLDFERWSPHVAPGGLIVFHDYNMKDVARFVDEVVRVNRRMDPSLGKVVDNVFATTKR